MTTTPTQPDGHCANYVLDPVGAAEFLKISDRHLLNLQKKDPTFPKPRRVGTLPRWTSQSLLRWVEGPALEPADEAQDQRSVEAEAPKRARKKRSETDV